MHLQSYLEEAFKRWKPRAPSVMDRTKCSIELCWNDLQPFSFVADQLIYRIERNNKIPRWVLEYSGGHTTKLINNLAPRHPYRFRLRVILKSSAVPTFAERALKHFGEESKVYDELKYIFDPSKTKERQESTDEVLVADEEHRNTSSAGCNKWLESGWSEETWTSTDTDGTSAVCFSMAVRCGYTAQVQVMLEERPSLVGVINSTNGHTPLASAVRKGDLNMVKLLLSAGAEVDQPSSAGQSALHVAVLGRQLDIVRLLMDRGADLKIRDVNGLQVEHYAVDSGDLDTLKLVLDSGGDLAAVDNNGWTPLFRAVCQGASTAMIEELMHRGSNPDVKDCAGLPLTALARVLKNRHGRPRDSVLRLVDSNYPHEKALANFTRLSKKIYHVHTVFK